MTIVKGLIVALILSLSFVIYKTVVIYDKLDALGKLVE